MKRVKPTKKPVKARHADRALLDARVGPEVGARLLDLTYNAINAAEKKGVFGPRDDDNKWNLKHFLCAYVETQRRPDIVEKQKREAALFDAKIQEAELKLAERRGEVIPADRVWSELSQILGKMFADFDGISPRITRDVSLRRKIQKELDDFRNRWALELRTRSKAIGSDRAGGGRKTKANTGRMGDLQ